jgi:peroxiredoxin
MDRSVGRLYNVERPADDPFAEMPRRITYLIDPEGTVARIYEVTDVGAHPVDVLGDLHELTGTVG